MTSNFIQITPFMHVANLKEAIAWFDLLGFKPLLCVSNYAYMAREQIGVRVLESTPDEGGQYPPHGGFACYVDVRDVDAIHRELAPKLTAAGVEFMGPKDQTYRQRELMIRAPDGNVFVFGQAIEGPVTNDC